MFPQSCDGLDEWIAGERAALDRPKPAGSDPRLTWAGNQA